MPDLKKLIDMARRREGDPTAHEYIEPLCFALEGALSEIEILRNMPGVKLQTQEIAEAFSKPKDTTTEVIPDHPFKLRDECQEPGCGKTIGAHGSSVWLQSMLRVKIEALRWAYKQCFTDRLSGPGASKIRAEMERLEKK
jgi:hypothetical protein